MTVTRNLERFYYTNFQIGFLKKNFFEKLKYRFLVEGTTMENVTFPYNTALSKANVKTNRMCSTRWTYPKERGFATLIILFS